MLQLFYAFITAMSAALIMVPFLRRWALDKQTVDLPDARKVHSAPIPRLGGIAVFLAFLFSALIFTPLSQSLRGLFAGALIIFATGIADDLDGLRSRNKFIGQIIGCMVTIVVGNLWLHNLGDLFGTGPILLPVWLGVPFTVFAVVGVTNAINLIDGLDGLAGGVSVIALTAIALLGLLDGDPLSPFLAAALSGAVLGFLKYNFYPARIFMGDTGSLTLGFVLGFLAVQLTQHDGANVSPMLPVMTLALPLFDAIWVMGRRLIKGTNPFVADNSHVHHKFLSLGFEHRFTVLTIYTISLFWACSAVLLQAWPGYALLLYLLGTAGCCYAVLRYLINHRENFSFFQRDSTGPLRQSVIFNRCADTVDRTLPLLGALLAVYALVAVVTAFHDGHRAWPVALVLLISRPLLSLLKVERGGEFQMLVVYAAGCLAAFDIWSFDHPVILDLSAKRCGDILLVLSCLIVALKLFFRRAGDLFLSSTDYLALTLMVFLIISSRQMLFGGDLGGPLLRAILLMFAARIFASHGPAFRKLLVKGTLVLLAVFALSGLVL